MPNRAIQHDERRELLCVDPDVGERQFSDYLAETLSDEQRQAFDDHLVLCDKCQEELAYARWALQQISAVSASASHARDESRASSLPLTSWIARQYTDMAMEYEEKPSPDQLAAATAPQMESLFPVGVQYGDGTVTGEFWDYMGQLFFRLKRCPDDVAPVLCYACPPSHNPRIVALLRDQDVLLGSTDELLPARTLAELRGALNQRFQLVLTSGT